jgi:hypothetical protein
MSVGSHPAVLNALFNAPLLTQVTQNTNVTQDAYVYPPMMFENVQVPGVGTAVLSYKKYVYEVTSGSVNLLLYFFLEISYNGNKGDTLYFSLPEVPGTVTSFYLQVGNSPCGHPPQTLLTTEDGNFYRLLPGSTENNGLAAIMIYASGSYSECGFCALVSYDTIISFT